MPMNIVYSNDYGNRGPSQHTLPLRRGTRSLVSGVCGRPLSSSAKGGKLRRERVRLGGCGAINTMELSRKNITLRIDRTKILCKNVMENNRIEKFK